MLFGWHLLCYIPFIIKKEEPVISSSYLLIRVSKSMLYAYGNMINLIINNAAKT